jgi:integrase
MASIAHDKGGRKRICFIGADGAPKAIRLGVASEKTARTFKEKVEKILEAKLVRAALDPDVAKWVADLPAGMHDRMVRAGLADTRAAQVRATVGGMLAAFFAGADVKPATRVRMKQAEAAIIAHFSDAREVGTITNADADTWRSSLVKAGYAAATISRTVLYARQMFRFGVRRGMLATNPFAELKAGAQVNHARSAFISRETIAKVLDAAPDAEWRLLIALSRFGGLRVPSEALALRWCDVDWAHGRITVRSPKTEHHEGKGERSIPIFAELKEHLEAAFDAAPVGAVYVIGRYREGANLNPHFRRLIKRAGIAPWDRTWHNLRASRQTELATNYPLHTACAWIGNTKAIAAGHYLQVTDADWQRATGAGYRDAQSGAHGARQTAQHMTAPVRTGMRNSPESTGFTGDSRAGAKECNPATERSNGQGRT